ncbi:MAG: HupE/UreJ family protein [Candidatus Competibacteraceae bacterium]|nr:HupE/UreJ family protein [Candidatus Competibacteraceae bacterium]MBK8896505.1 HupE/UreJ family protein [Candidatus Competibacteraceae bacterium]
MTAPLTRLKALPAATANNGEGSIAIGGWFVPLIPLATLLIFLLGAAPVAFAHKPSDSYLRLTPRDSGWQGRWDIALRDLEYAIGLDQNGDGDITWGELQGRESAVVQYALAHLRVRSSNGACNPRPGALQVVEHGDGAYAVLDFALLCPSAGAQTLDYQLFFSLDPSHRGLLRVDAPSGTETAVLSPAQSQRMLNAAPAGGGRQFLNYWEEGVWHIWSGFDHILFLLALLLPAVLWWENGRWRPAPALRAVVLETAAIVTAFTLAHSLTLTLAVLGVVDLPGRLVESTIALTVLLAALNNVFPVVTARRWLLAFALGLIHGFGFAGVLRELGLPEDTLALALAGFNLGVETGQLAIVAVTLPLAFALRQTWLYRRLALPVGSAAVALLALVWCLERGLNVPLLSAFAARDTPKPILASRALLPNLSTFTTPPDQS